MSKSKKQMRETTPCAQTEDALRKERDLFSAVIDTAAVLVVVLNPQGQTVRFNRACERVTGYKFDEVKDKPFWDVFLIPEEAEAVKEVFGRLRAGQFPNEHENHWVTKDGRHRLIAWSNTALLDDHGSVEYIIGTGIDITERRQAREQLRGLSRAVEQSPSSIVITDTAGNIEYVNPKFTQVTGYTSEEVVGKNPSLLKSGETPPEEYGRLWKTITSGGEWRGEFHNKKKNGELYWESASISPITDAHGVVTHFLAVKEDITQRKQVEETLRKSEERFRKLAETTAAGIFIYKGTKFLYVSPVTETLTGYTAQELLEMSFWDIVHPDFRERVKERGLARQRGESIPPRYEFKIITKSGEERWLDIAAGTIELEGELAGIVTVYDITERKGMEESLKQSEVRFRSLIENAPVGIAVARGGLTLYANSAYLRMFGYADEAELYGTPLTNQIAPPYREEIMERTRRREEGEAVPSPYETVGLRKDRSSFPFHVSVTRIELSDGPASIAFFTDITERKRAEETVRDSEEKFRALLEFASVAIVIVDGHGLIQLVNAKVEEVFGYARRELLGHPVEVLLPERFRHTHVGLRGSFFSNPRPRPMNAPLDLWAVRRDGTEFPVEVGLSPVQTKDGVLVMSYLTDITERRRAEEALRAALRRAQEVDQLKTQLLSIVSHELRTPLTSIRGQTTTLLDYADQVTPEERLEALQIVDDEAERLDELISHLLDMSRLEAGKLPVELGATDVRPILIEAVSRIAAHAPSHELVVNLPPTLPPVRADPRRVVQVMSNLLDNAIKFSPPGATVTVDAEVDADTIRVRVRDVGPGIAPEHLPHIFDRFYRVEETGVRTSGAGLGLAICKGLVEAMGGQVAVTSQVGQGSVFSFSLLRAQGV
jgi:PAS domain S-box-containing protein